jgi:hypothetical protein
MEFNGLQRILYATARNGATELGTALAARFFLHTFLLEVRERANQPDFAKRLRKKLAKFDARTSKGNKAGVTEAVAITQDSPVRVPELPTGTVPEPQRVSE